MHFSGGKRPVRAEDMPQRKEVGICVETVAGWTESDFRHVENTASSIELAALMSGVTAITH